MFQKYEKPPNSFTLQHQKHPLPTKDISNHTRGKSASLPRNVSSKSNSNQFGVQPRRSNDEQSHQGGGKSNRAYDANRLNRSPSKSDALREHVNSLQNSTTKATIRAVNPPQLNNEPGIVDGYLENVSEIKTKTDYIDESIILFCRVLNC